jgi:hypothetical protein
VILTQTSEKKRQTKRVATQFFKHMEMIITRTQKTLCRMYKLESNKNSMYIAAMRNKQHILGHN